MTPEEYYEQELELLRVMWEGDIFPALFEAIQACAVWNIPLPEWASVGALDCILSAYENGFIGDHQSQGGRLARRRERTRNDYRHYLRWSAVRSQLWIRGLDALPKDRGRPKKDEVLRLGEPGMTRRSVLEDARQVLCQNPERRKLSRPGDKDESLAQSFNLVEESRRAGEVRFMFERLNTTLPKS